MYLPEPCHSTELVGEHCMQSISYEEALKPGLMTLYSFKEMGEAGNLTTQDCNDTFVEGNIHVFIEYMDSFTTTRKVVSTHELPPQCAVGYMMDSANPCIAACATAVIRAAGLTAVTKRTPLGILSVAGVPLTPSYFYKGLGSVGAFASKGHTALFGLGAVRDCWNCLYNRFVSVPFADVILFNDIMLICIYQE
jgi:hypothetical protein